MHLPLPTLRPRIRYRNHIAAPHLLLKIEKHALIVGQLDATALICVARAGD